MKNQNLTKTQVLNRLEIYAEILTKQSEMEKRVPKGSFKNILKEENAELEKEIAELKQILVKL
jgi:hypothetical protein